MEQLLRETLLASGTALLGIFLLPLALVREMLLGFGVENL